MIIRPQAGPQERFLATKADIAIYGGAAGGGKSFALLLEAIRHIRNPKYAGVIFRKNYGDITNPGGLWDTSMEIYPYLGGVPRESKLDWIFPCGASVEFAHFQLEKNRLNWQGSQVPFMGWDEATHFSKQIFFYMLSRNRSMCGVRPYMRLTCNPDPDHWLREFIGWWLDDDGLPIAERDGVVRYFTRKGDDFLWADSLEEAAKKNMEQPRSVTFIAARLSDNPALMEANPEYIGNLLALPGFERKRLLDGDWNARATAGSYFKRGWFPVVDAAPENGDVVRYWDRAATEKTEASPDPDYTAGVRMRRAANRIYYIEDVVRERLSPGGVQQLIRNTAEQDGREVKQVLEEDPGQAGKSDVATLIQVLDGFHVGVNRVTTAKEIRARPFSSQCQAGNVRLVRGKWNKDYLAELEGFPVIEHDDQVDGSSGAYLELSERGNPRVR